MHIEQHIWESGFIFYVTQCALCMTGRQSRYSCMKDMPKNIIPPVIVGSEILFLDSK